jgi:hypothetical protein
MREALFRDGAVPQNPAGPSAGRRQRRDSGNSGADRTQAATRKGAPPRRDSSRACESRAPYAEPAQPERRSEVSRSPAGPRALTPRGPLIRLVSKTLLKTVAWTILRVLERDLRRTEAAQLSQTTHRQRVRIIRRSERSNERGYNVLCFTKIACGSRPPQPLGPQIARGMSLAGLLSDSERCLGVLQESER